MPQVKNTGMPGKFIHEFIGSINIISDFVLSTRDMAVNKSRGLPS